MSNTNILQNLNPEQLQAVQATGAVLCLAGAGSGKTSVLTKRTIYLVQEKGVNPENILAVTFTNKAAQEMQERIAAIIGPDAEKITVCTFHSFCARMLRAKMNHVKGYKNNFTIFDDTDTHTIIKRVISQMNWDVEPVNVLTHISIAKTKGVPPEQYTAKLSNDITAPTPFELNVETAYKMYQAELKSNNALDFDDLLFFGCHLLQNDTQVFNEYAAKYKYILVDEYQDTNSPQYLIVKTLAKHNNEIFAVGDINQSIYGWRGADINNIMDFTKDFPNAKVIRLQQNYRSSQSILDAANAVIRRAPGNSNINLWSQLGKGERITRYSAPSEISEADYIIRQIHYLKKRGLDYKDIAILYRSNVQSIPLEQKLLQNNMPYRTVGGTQFYDRKEIKDILAYLRVLANPYDDVAFCRIVNTPKRGIGDATVAKLKEYASDKNIPLAMAVSMFEEDDFPLKGVKLDRVKDFAELLYGLISDASVMPVDKLISHTITTTGYTESIGTQKQEEGPDRIGNLSQLVQVAEEYIKDAPDTSLVDFLSNSVLVQDIENDQNPAQDNAVKLMTIHAAKGLEFPVVFIVGAEEGLLPFDDSSYDKFEEERRLFYVAVTRAKQKLYITNALHKISPAFSRQTKQLKLTKYQNIPCSRFVKDIPQELLITHT